MPRLVMQGARRFGAAVLVLAATVLAQPLAGQAPSSGLGDERLAVVNAVLQFRLYWMEDATPVDVCSLYVQAGRPAGFPAGIPTELRDALGLLSGVAAVIDPPVCPASADAVPKPRLVQFVRMAVADSVATVRLSVRKGDQAHLEDYSVRRGALGGWVAVEVRLWGTLYVHPPRPDRPG